MSRERLYKSADIEVSLEDISDDSGLASIDEVVVRVLTQLNQRLEDARQLRKNQTAFKLGGTQDLPDGRQTIN